MTNPAVSPPLELTRVANRVVLYGGVRTNGDRDLLTDTAHQAISTEEPNVVIDVRALGYADTAFLAMLVTLSRRCIDAKKQLVLEGCSEDLLTQLRVTNIDQVLRGQGATITPAAA